MPILLRKADLLRRFKTHAGIARAFKPILGHPLSRQAPVQWEEFIPALRAHELLSHYEDLCDDVVDIRTGRTPREERESMIEIAEHEL